MLRKWPKAPFACRQQKSSAIKKRFSDGLKRNGDAAHRMPPYAGEGANVALQDSFELAECLTGNQFGDVKSAIAHFEKGMVARGAEATKDTLENSERMFSKTGLAQMTEFFKHVKDWRRLT
jgi:2-polyprenyl-6-methoxyphenol hydroxylase-like FAD-dependent oxidoreductase